MLRRRQPKGAFFEPGSDFWRLKLDGDPVEFLVELAKVLPPGQTLYVEGTRSPLISAYLLDRPAQEPLAIAAGTIWPRPDFHHMPLTEDNMADLAELMNQAAAPEVGDHIHAYRGTTAFLVWYDYPDSTPFVRRDVPETDIERLCRALGAEYSSFD